MNLSPRLSIVVISNRDWQSHRPLVESLLQQSDLFAVEILWVNHFESLPTDFFEFPRTLISRHLPSPVPHHGNRSRDFGALQSRGDWILFLDDDTSLIEPKQLGELLAIVQSTTFAEVVRGRYRNQPRTRAAKIYSKIQSDFVTSQGFLVGGAVLIKKSAYLRCRPFSLDIAYGGADLLLNKLAADGDLNLDPVRVFEVNHHLEFNFYQLSLKGFRQGLALSNPATQEYCRRQAGAHFSWEDFRGGEFFYRFPFMIAEVGRGCVSFEQIQLSKYFWMWRLLVIWMGVRWRSSEKIEGFLLRAAAELQEALVLRALKKLSVPATESRGQ